MAAPWAKTFYNSKQWRYLARVYRESHFHVCERCGKPGAREVHHKIHLTQRNVSDPNIALNPDNLILLCYDCHNEEHERMKYRKPVIRTYTYDSRGNIVSVTEPETYPPLP
ncbi:prophage LambdaBa04 gp54 like protein (plasmid) [Selenomonas ruminantium subsp. lactilytica TAM6421]|uniref:Prophage LambdaBa04 gp54 like protein n=1 Tax=Selenomonas ruminantium subsp. lactilytica (strain NBRC 103574 / TAM6421) TaxID=927704 RepID=I0GWQ4_SELRL|nr:HNH endonuclease signature motif containing protein [Selenomonas ruminantium]BAL85191.1 prophage LambdaBa04 gp54 like protein [Selenomonas ruminantium subsp. lactilytica TAM6421]